MAGDAALSELGLPARRRVDHAARLARRGFRVARCAFAHDLPQRGGDVEHPADCVPRGRIVVMGQVSRRQLHERHEHRLGGKHVPGVVQRRRERNHATAADPAFDHRRRAVVELGEDVIGRGGRERAIAIEPRGVEIAAVRLLEQFENRVAVVERIPASPAARACDRPSLRACPGAAAIRRSPTASVLRRPSADRRPGRRNASTAHRSAPAPSPRRSAR